METMQQSTLQIPNKEYQWLHSILRLTMKLKEWTAARHCSEMSFTEAIRFGAPYSAISTLK